MSIFLNARSYWDELPPCDHFLICYAVAVLALRLDSIDPYTYCHLRTHFLYTAIHFGASHRWPNIDGIPYCVGFYINFTIYTFRFSFFFLNNFCFWIFVDIFQDDFFDYQKKKNKLIYCLKIKMNLIRTKCCWFPFVRVAIIAFLKWFVLFFFFYHHYNISK